MSKYFKTKHEKDSARITSLIAILLILLIFIVGPKYMDPPIEYGVAVNFGTSNVGSGNKQPLKPIKSEPVHVNKQPKVSESKSLEPVSIPKTEKVLTEENEEAIAIKKQKEAEARRKAEAEGRAKAEAERKAKEQREKEKKRKEVDDLFGGISKSDGEVSGSEGNDDKVADNGDINGNPYAPSYFGPGSGTGGVGYGLKVREKVRNDIFTQDCDKEGLIIVEIRVNQKGIVTKAKPGIRGTTGDICLYDAAKKTALSFRFTPDNNAPTEQVGYVSINFSLGRKN